MVVETQAVGSNVIRHFKECVLEATLLLDDFSCCFSGRRGSDGNQVRCSHAQERLEVKIVLDGYGSDRIGREGGSQLTDAILDQEWDKQSSISRISGYSVKPDIRF